MNLLDRSSNITISGLSIKSQAERSPVYRWRISRSLIPIRYSNPSNPTADIDRPAFSLTTGLA